MTSTSPTNALPTMRAWTHNTAGLPSTVLSLSSSIPRPPIKDTSRVLIRVDFAALNPGGSIMMQLLPTIFRTKPCIPELDFAGTVEQLGDAYPLSGPLLPGVAVFASIPVGDHVRGSGSLAEYVAVEPEFVVPLPSGMQMQEAAGLAVAGCTALSLVDAAGLKEGLKVLVNAAGGGIGNLVTQMVRDKIGENGKLVAVCSGEKEEMVRGLGADEVMDYREQPIYEALRSKHGDAPFDVVIDALGVQALFESCPGFLKQNGSFITVGVLYTELSYYGMAGMLVKMAKNILWPAALGGVPRKYHQVASAVNEPDLTKLGALCAAGKLKVMVDSVWAFEDVLKAYERMLSQRASGKVIVKT